MGDKTVKIAVNQGVITARPDIVKLSKAAKDRVAWEGDEEFEIKFNPKDCPFKSDSYKSSGRKAKSDEAKVGPREEPYAYTIKLVSSKSKSDPGVRIDR